MRQTNSKPEKGHVLWRMPVWVDSLLWETLRVDSGSSAFDKRLRRKLGKAMRRVHRGAAHRSRGRRDVLVCCDLAERRHDRGGSHRAASDRSPTTSRQTVRDGVIEHCGGLEGDQEAEEEIASSLGGRYLVVESGRDGSRRWFTSFTTLNEMLRYAASRAREDEWGVTNAYDLDRGEKLTVEIVAHVIDRVPA